MDAFWFVDFSFLSLFSQEAVKAAVCMLCVQATVCGRAHVCIETALSSSVASC